jgi:hypothetical protein
VGPPPCSGVLTAGTTTTGADQKVVVTSDTPTVQVTIPDGVTSISVHACGAKGGAAVAPTMTGGSGAWVSRTVPVSGGPTLTVVAGSHGIDGTPGGTGSPAAGTGGYLGGGDGNSGGGGGGGLSGVFSGATPSQANALVVAGGGGGGSNVSPGGAAPGPGSTSSLDGQDAGGTPPGSGGGGGGYSGGAAAAQALVCLPGTPPVCTPVNTPSQGGSNLGDPQGTNTSPDGAVVITYTLPASTITTHASPPAPSGGSISDTATVTSAGATPTGDITFRLYGPNDADCTGTAVQTNTKPLTAGSAQSDPYTGASGVYRYTAQYSGDANHAPAQTACNEPNESTSIGLRTTGIVTNATPSAPIGSSISDSATVTATTDTPSGTITFRLYGPNDTACATTPVYTATKPVTNGDANSGPYQPATAGMYRWTAAYSGNANNSPATSGCNAANEFSDVQKATTAVTTNATPGPVREGQSVSDSATVSLGYPPVTGTVTFDLYGPSNSGCSGSAAWSSGARPLVNGDASSGPSPTTLAPGTYTWKATYSGDANNNGVSTCGGTNETSTIIARESPSLVTQATPSASTGSQISDAAHVGSPGPTPTGTVQFDLYGPSDTSCTGSTVFTSTRPLDSNGDATSAPYTTSAPGTYRWIARYSGDVNTLPRSGTCNDPNENSVVSTQNTGGGSTPTPTTTTTASPSPTATATSSPTSSPTGTATRAPLRLSTTTPDITPGRVGSLHVTGTTGEEVQLFCYSKPSSTYTQTRPKEPGQGVVLTNGATDFSVFPGTNTRCVAQYLNDASTRSNSVAINVHTVLSLSAYRDGVRRYHFQGTNLPRRPGQLITLFRYATGPNLDRYCVPAPESDTANTSGSGCTAIRTATAFTNSSNTWRINRTFTGSGRFYFVVRTSQNANNARGHSNQRLTVIH